MITQQKDTLRGWLTSGDLWIWLNAAAVGISIAAVGGLLGLIAARGLAHFWPADIAQISFTSVTGEAQLAVGEIVESESVDVAQYRDAMGDQSARPDSEAAVERWLIKTGNRKEAAPDFQWIFTHRITDVRYPPEQGVFERLEWGNAYGELVAVLESGTPIAELAPHTESSQNSTEVASLWQEFLARLDRVSELRARIHDVEDGEFNSINYELERVRLSRRGLELDASITAAELAGRSEALDAREAALHERYTEAETQLAALIRQLERDAVVVQISTGARITTKLSDIVRAWRPNQMSWLDKTAHYFRTLWLFLTEDPREANTEGGIFPAIFGTVLMVLLMSLLVTPLGVIAAVYLREYARQGLFVRLIRIAVNNLAGVPSIVYGVFGLGFFVYFIGGNLDQLFFEAALPAPTFGTPGLMWASLTLALLTVPVVIVSTEEGLTRIPRSLREGSMALGATRAETLFKVVLPIASPSILTGVILAVARAAGEVAPLMLVGVVKLAPTLPLDGNFPFLHLERKFMHLGFHIYDVGFQSPNVEAARPLVFATAFLLVLIILILNLTAIMLRTRLENRYRGVEG
ncbi:MAG: phosphate ABC transporter permease PstA [Pseudomonadales bacterium]|nr:phosphate ABC transporter permease PstA [Pseudomonadales bacterium]